MSDQPSCGTLDVRGSGSAWAVFAPGGERLTPHYSCQFTAICAANRLEQATKTKSRPCLCCGTPFKSTGAGHRMCNRCRTLGDGLR